MSAHRVKVTEVRSTRNPRQVAQYVARCTCGWSYRHPARRFVQRHARAHTANPATEADR